jgi:carbamoyl-phosphate synthase large subunit
MKTINVLLTCVASQVMPEKIKLIKSFPGSKVNIIGIDAKPQELSVGANFCKEFFQAPIGKDKNYTNFVLDLVRKQKINIIFCGSDEEIITLSKIKDQLKNKFNCTLIGSDYKTTKLISNKHEMLKIIKKNNISICEFSNPKKIKDIDLFSKKIGYPKKNFIIKPKKGRGSKGFKIITEKINEKVKFFQNNSSRIKLKELKSYFHKYPREINKFVLMEYLPGDKYSVDMLAEKGKIILAVARNNWKEPKINPPTQLADIVFDVDVQEYAKSVCELTEADFFIQVEIGRKDNGELAFIESNPRLDATLPITMGLGVNFYHELMYYALNGEYKDKIKIKKSKNKIRFFRYWNHIFIKQ